MQLEAEAAAVEPAVARVAGAEVAAVEVEAEAELEPPPEPERRTHQPGRRKLEEDAAPQLPLRVRIVRQAGLNTPRPMIS